MLEILYGSGDFLTGVILFIILAVALLFSIISHEVAHGLVALWNGDPTAKLNGRLSLNPAKHFDLIGTLMILFVGFGYAKPVPINPYNFRHYRRGCILVSIAGVTMNLIIAFFGSALYVLFSRLNSNGSAIMSIVALFFNYLAWFNIVLCFFNILPFYPLDGFNLIKSLCKRENGFIRFMQSYGQYILFALLIVSIIVGNIPGLPSYFSPIDLYFNYTARYVDEGFIKLWSLIFGGI